jgi:hypothetical protein
MNKKELLKTAKPILFNTEMTRAINDGRKVQTRRLVALENNNLTFSNMQGFDNVCALFDNKDSNETYVFECVKPKYKKGDVLWVREPAIVTNYISRYDCTKIEYQLKADKTKEYRIDVPTRFFPNPKKWIKECQSVPNGCIKEMARTFLKVTDVRVERLHDMTFEDIFSEGFNGQIKTYFIGDNYKNKMRTDNGNGLDVIVHWWINLWNSTSKDGYKWKDNRPVFVYEFEVIK